MQVFEAIEPIYEELSRDELLIRCLGGFTQNSNESFNSIVWSMAPKTISSGKTVLDTAVYLATLSFNDGFSAIMKVMEQLDIVIGLNCYNFCCEADAERVKQSERSLTEEAKEARRELTSTRKDEDEDNLHLESQLYGQLYNRRLEVQNCDL
ncbi:PREDICTED: uncharacterized protein LOC108759359 [Trachymyrmex cornetzi]|uniref:uncharacterized protein LOC108759359 n=1 Tax=Trachymyrmex cornetzi TaxID=471704 RepID=UPI00084F19E0|nr:PREDICTED: uncharacterized protein LOC108759359 [Trachymyrmex cornetzi]